MKKIALRITDALGIYIYQSELQESEKRYQNLIKSTSVVVWEIDIASQQFTYIGPQIKNLTGFPPEQWKDFKFWSDRIYSEVSKI